ncbi:formylmethanofuran dehydrogenase subunit C [Archaeoglobus veneficus]|uniref:formylmethanofuran dehydrogenase n=1 Tax=Archaeoglobus veneficus (strain DSM 11195 / SNP6) TaxID=693661 RepID=F2KT94_ARCVS|nr:formylmethanofuran dehydrogenase subunit C [Archaeoglobus veneficus]AEA47124.1 formylmethanofuran dehydrogenase subunit C [Archaeoglobus veneficus SNP6]
MQNVCVLRLKDKPDLCIEVDALLPEKLSGMNAREIENVKIQYGKLLVDAGEFFDIEGKVNGTLVFEGDLTRVKRIGFGMREGEIIVKGNAGMYVGAFMRGGRIVIEGNAGRFAAIGMIGGEVVVKGDCGDYAGAAYRGSTGMAGGRLIIEGRCGDEAGANMCGGELIVGREAGAFLGAGMTGGVIRAKTGRRVGAGMINGQIFLDEAKDIDEVLPPGFIYEGEEEINGVKYAVFTGDKAEKKSNGKIFIKIL